MRTKPSHMNVTRTIQCHVSTGKQDTFIRSRDIADRLNTRDVFIDHRINCSKEVYITWGKYSMDD
jgi:hypothetical protein